MFGPLVWFCFSENMTKINRSLWVLCAVHHIFNTTQADITTQSKIKKPNVLFLQFAPEQQMKSFLGVTLKTPLPNVIADSSDLSIVVSFTCNTTRWLIRRKQTDARGPNILPPCCFIHMPTLPRLSTPTPCCNEGPRSAGKNLPSSFSHPWCVFMWCVLICSLM